jgi:hypothetical protein
MPRYFYNEVSQDCGLVTQPQNTDDDVTTIRGYVAYPLQVPLEISRGERIVPRRGTEASSGDVRGNKELVRG